MKKIFIIAALLLLGLAGLFVVPFSQAEQQTKATKNHVTIQAAGRGLPTVNLSDGKNLIQTLAGEDSLVESLNNNAASPRSLMTADFDEDGTPDLVAGFDKSGGGILTLARGNVDAVYANSPEAKQRKMEGTFTDAPFLVETKIFATPETVDFLGAGDFDADGHWDLVCAARESHSLFWLAGDGRGNFGAAQEIKFDGVITALTVGEINRPDGLNEIIVGTSDAKVFVFEHPTGALRGKPEVFDLITPASSLALGKFDDDFNFDLTVGGGTNLLLIKGRDRKLSHLESVRNRVPKAETQTLTFLFEIEAIAVGNFVRQKDSQTEIALLSKDNEVHLLKRGAAEPRSRGEWKEDGVVKIPQSAVSSNVPRWLVTSRTAISPLDTLLVNTGDNQLHVISQSSEKTNNGQQTTDNRLITLESENRPIAVLPMRLNVDALNDLVILTEGETAPSIVLTESPTAGVVTTTADSGPGSLREATTFAGLVTFDIPGAGPHIINLASPLPLPPTGFVTPRVIDGTTQPGFSGSPLVVVNGAALPSGANALTLISDTEVVRGLAFVNSPTAIYIRSNQDFGFNIVEGNYIGVMPDGTTAAPNAFGIRIERSDNNTIGGTTAAARNVIASSSVSIDISGASTFSSTENMILGNYIGTNAAGTAGLNPINGAGIDIRSYARETIVGGTVSGGPVPGARNVISSINIGIAIRDTFNRVQGNYIGTDASGSYSIFNNSGIVVSVASPTVSQIRSTIGGTTPAARNLISGNRGAGLSLGQLGGNATGGEYIVQGNWVGVSSTGLPLPNGGGINLFFTNALIGGTVSGAGNLIAHNLQSGIFTDNTFPIRVGIIGNSIHSNRPDPVSLSLGAGLGIDLVPFQSPYGVTLNDLDDADTGPNDLQNFPVITSATSAGGNTNIVGTLNSRTDGSFTQFRIEFFSNPSCDPLGHGEGRTFLGATEFNQVANVFTASFDVTLPVSVPRGSFITATATRNFLEVVDDNAMTSEFSQCFQTTIGSRAHEITDFTGDGVSDFALFRPADGLWMTLSGLGGTITNQQWGLTGDIPQPADYDGDGRTDFAIYRPSTATWWILQSSNGSVTAVPFGVSTDKPVAADFTGDGRTELAVYRPSMGDWWILNLADSSVMAHHWGVMEDKPVPQDYDGDGRADLAVFRPSSGIWYIFNSNTNSFTFTQFGMSEDKPVAGDYDADGRADIAVWRPSSGIWYILRSSNNSFLALSWGTSGDVPQPGDFDGDNRNDFVVWRPSNTTWYVLQSSNFSFSTSVFGNSTDLPASSPYRIE